MTDNQPSGALVPASTRQEVGLDIAAVVTSVVPWLGGPVSVVLGGMAAGRRYKRVSEALGGLFGRSRRNATRRSVGYIEHFFSISSPRQDNLTMTKSAFCARWSFYNQTTLES